MTTAGRNLGQICPVSTNEGTLARGVCISGGQRSFPLCSLSSSAESFLTFDIFCYKFNAPCPGKTFPKVGFINFNWR